jgi:hypothetical protein
MNERVSELSRILKLTGESDLSNSEVKGLGLNASVQRV